MTQIKTECRNVHGLFVDVDAGDLVAEQFTKLGAADASAVLLSAKVAHHAPERFNEKDSRTTGWIDHARFSLKDLRSEGLRQNIFDQGWGSVVRAVVPALLNALVVEFLVYRADQFDWDYVKSVGKKEKVFLI